MAIKGKALPKGGTVGVCSPAFCYGNRSEIRRGVEWWEHHGYNVKLADNIYDRRGYVAGDPKARAQGINDMFGDPEVDIVQCADAGFGSAHTIPYVDFDAIAGNPKAFIGYSDITALHAAIRHHTGLVTFYGPLLSSLNVPDPDHKREFTEEKMFAALTSSEPFGEMPRNPDDHYLHVFNGGKSSGELVGGCLWLLAQTIGTPWQIDLDGKILFFEDVDSPPWYVDGALTQMTQAGMLDNVAGVVIGEMTRCDWSKDRADGWPQIMQLEDVFEDHIEPLGVPALYGFPMGHGKYLATTPLGVRATLDADAKTLTIDEAALEA